MVVQFWNYYFFDVFCFDDFFDDVVYVCVLCVVMLMLGVLVVVCFFFVFVGFYFDVFGIVGRWWRSGFFGVNGYGFFGSLGFLNRVSYLVVFGCFSIVAGLVY